MSDLQFTPAWLLLLPVLIFIALRCPRMQLHRPSRAIPLLCMLLILCQPAIPSRRGGMDLWVLLDRSASVGGLMDRQQREWRDLLKNAKPGHRDKIHFIDFAEDAVPSLEGVGTELSTSRRGKTRIPTAIEYALSRHDTGRPTRLLAITDGYTTDPMGKTATRLAAMGIPLDYRLIEPPAKEDYRITELAGPSRVQAGEAFLIRATVTGFGAVDGAQIPISISRNGVVLNRATITLRDGTGTIDWADRINSGGSHLYRIQIQPEEDAYPGNNHAETWVEISTGPRILVISRHPDDPLAEALASQGLKVELRTDPSEITPAFLSGAKAVVINNIPSHDLSLDFLKSLDFFVRHQGGGLLMVGGRHSFGAGGYFQSSIDELLPVSMELKADHRKLMLAMVIVLDRSGSMMASAAGAPNLTKMDLANQGAAAAIELLGDHDSVSVIAVDDRPHVIMPLTRIQGQRINLVNRARSIQSSGGGIYVYEGLEAAADQLKKAKVGTRHIILFADANDAEQPGNYKKLISKLVNEGTTISVVGLGKKTDSDADLLQDIAKLGDGRIHFAENAKDLPKLFAGETVAVARSAFISEPVGVLPTGEWRELSPLPMEWLTQLDGYNLSYARPGSSVAAISTDEFSAPLVATIRRGLGRTAAVSFPLSGKHSEQVRNWVGYKGFVRTLGRWLSGNPVPPGIGLTHHIQGSNLTLNLHYDAGLWNSTIASHPPRLFVASGEPDSEPREITWARLAPGHFSTSLNMREEDVLRGVVQIGEHTLPFGPISVPMAIEWTFDPTSRMDLKLASSLSGGVERNDLSTAWLRPPVTQYSDLRLPLAILALLFLLYDAYASKTGFRMPLPPMPRPRRVKSKIKKNKPSKSKTTQPIAIETDPAEEMQIEENDTTTRRNRFTRAKNIRPK